MQSQVRFNRFRKRFRRRAGLEPGQVQPVSGEVPTQVPGSFGAEPGQIRVPEKVLEKVPEKVWVAVWCRAWSSSRVRKKVLGNVSEV